MCKIVMRPYSCLVDFQKVYDFMLQSYELDWRNGKPATAFEYSQLLYWADHTQSHRIGLWEDGDKVVGLCWYDSKIGKGVLCNLTPGYEAVVPDMIDYSEKRLSEDDGSLQLILYRGQDALIGEAQKRGYQLLRETKEGIYDFSTNRLNYALPSGYHFIPLIECDRKKLQDATWQGFDNEGESEGGVETVRRLDTAPHRTAGLDVAIVDDKGEYACYAMMWMIPENRLAYLEPLSTVPKHRGKGLAAAALSELVRRTAPFGATHMTGGSSPFYFKIGYDPITTSTVWERPNASV